MPPPAPSTAGRRSAHRCAAACDAPTGASPSARGSSRVSASRVAVVARSCSSLESLQEVSRSFRWLTGGELLLLRFLELDLLTHVAHTFTLVGLRRAERANVGGDLADLLDVRTLDRDFGLARGFDRDALGCRIDDRMRETESQIQVLA